ncbi:MAG TPA: M14 metallopeptidase family protein [Bryobacteraceae bacterium]|nr:M14 metallopeptidase family protein [Bryobacteraceae bacterium]
MLFRVLTVFTVAVLAALAAVPTPREHFGYEPGEDYKLAGYEEVAGYFQKLAASSDRIRLVEYGKSSLGRASYVAYISSPENLKRLDEFKEMNRKLALGFATPAESDQIVKQARAVVWIDSGLHASEVAPVQHSPLLAYKMLTDDSEEVQRIRENVILMQIPVINPDGLDMVASWYKKNVGTPYELAPLPMLYQKYAGHDNNRDWFMMNLHETRNAARLLFREWFPQIVYNQHQVPAFPARIFVPPYAEPLNPNIPAPVMEGINSIGSAIKERLARENKPGVLSYHGFDAWWNGGLRSAPAFHNMHGILTETAGSGYATPRVYDPGLFPERFGNGIPTKQPTVFYERPWLGGKWTLRDAIDYMLTADLAILDLATSRRESLLRKAWEVARANIEMGRRGGPYAYVVPDSPNALEMLQRLRLSGIEVSRARQRFTTAGKTYEAGTWVIPAGQAFRGYIVDLLEAQQYPELRAGTSGPTRRPYDVAGWTLPLLMGVAVDRVEKPFTVDLESVEPSPTSSTAFSGRKWPRIALYEPWQPNIDTGWTQWVFDRLQIPYTVLHNADVQKGDLAGRFDTIVFASQSTTSILHGFRLGETMTRTGAVPGETPSIQRPEYTGGIGLTGAAALDAFVRQGGVMVALDAATELPVELFGLPIRPLITERDDPSPNGYYCPGSILRLKVETAHPIANGTPAEVNAFSSGGQAWEVTLLPSENKGEREVKVVARYATSKVLASGWLSGERVIAGRPALVDARHGKGRVVLFGFRPQFRGQTWGTFGLLVNSLLR